jgi:1,4-dihydroxy-2-naphthoate octaprenyltransferase
MPLLSELKLRAWGNMGRISTLIKIARLGRLHFLFAGLLVYILGSLVAVLYDASFSAGRLAFGYLVLLPAHLSVSYSNDYFDADVDKFNKPTPFTGGSGVLVDSPHLRSFSKWFAIALIALSLLMSLAFIIVYSYPGWLLGYVLLGNLLGWFYTAPPVKLAYRGLGELSTAIAIGLIAGMGYLVMMGQLNGDVLVFAVPVFAYGLAFIVAVEIPDLEADRLGSKRTLITKIGRGFGFVLVAVLLFLASAYWFLLPTAHPSQYPLDLRVLGILSLLPCAMGFLGLIRRPARRLPATRTVNGVLVAFMVFLTMTDGYLAYLLVRG